MLSFRTPAVQGGEHVSCAGVHPWYHSPAPRLRRPVFRGSSIAAAMVDVSAGRDRDGAITFAE
jgi:hypothetical protein